MSEWWTYRPEDFLLFSPRVYWRMFELQNASLWPLPALMIAVGVIILILSLWQRPSSARAVSFLLAMIWILVAYLFFWTRYATINWAAAYLAPIFMVEGLLLFAAACRYVPVTFDLSRPAAWVGFGVLAFAILGFPLLAAWQGRGVMASELFGMAPDPTAFGTLGVILMLRGRALLLLMPVPVLWCLLSAATLWTMGETVAAWTRLAIALLAPLMILLDNARVQNRRP
ncbi:hypothetical protein FHS85_002533 [Rhodoligotrophos appendicifer]|uniref:DUF6064 family protein n=1 Tax=Rhodoligotrophos appendicifer TaxID=987056 RepID=UPI0011859AE8|nr:DUF6064 family protein [Rhodoligotrophos appendicifer]